VIENSIHVVLRHFHQYCYKNSLLWFGVEWTKALVHSSKMNTGDLRGLDRWSVIPYVHGRCCIAVSMVLLKGELNLSHFVACPAVYSSRACQLHCNLGPNRWLQGG
jgi:hypothetical protein